MIAFFIHCVYQHGYVHEHRDALQKVATALGEIQAVAGPKALPGEEISRHRQQLVPSETMEHGIRQVPKTKENRHSTGVEMAAFLGGTSGA